MDAVTTATLLAGAFALAGTLVGNLLNRSTASQIAALNHDLQRLTQHRGERHRFRHQIGHLAAQARLTAYEELAALGMAAYRAKMGKDWNDTTLMAQAGEAANAFLNYYYDHRFFFTEGYKGVEGAVKSLATSLKEDFPTKTVVEENVNKLTSVVRHDLLLDELAGSVGRAVDAGVE